MRNMNKKALSLTVLILLVTGIITSSIAQEGQADALLRREMQERRIPGLQAAVVQHGKIVLLRSYGIANIQDSVPVTDRSVFSINSCTKAFTGIAIMQLVQEGKVSLDAPVSKYVDSLPEQWQPVTVQQLLTHVSGLPDILRVLQPAAGGSEQEAWKAIKARPMDFPTGTQYSYNQTNYALLGKIIDKYSGKPFAQVFRERQFQVAGMSSTCFGDSYDIIANSAETYRYNSYFYGQPLGGEKLMKNVEEFPPFRRTASGLKSTATDLANWIIALQQGKLLTTPALNTLWTAGHYNDGSPTQWALGWVTKPRSRHRAVTASGGGRAAFFVYPEDDLAIVVLTNLAGAYPEEFIDELAGCYNADIPAADPVTALHMELRQQGFEHAEDIYRKKKKKDPGFQPTETDLNDWAYRMLSRGLKKEALEIFKLNTVLYPDSWNVYDSYGEALMKNGNKTEAVKMYQRSIALNPQNTYGKKVLAELLK